MNLLTDEFLSVRREPDGTHLWISLKELLCGTENYSFMYPRDDLELGALCLCISIVQCLWPPEDFDELKIRIGKPMSAADYEAGIRKYLPWFNLDDAKYPFMQVKGVKANDITPMDKLLPGLTGGTNCAFVNEPRQAAALCPGCAAIALFNDAVSAPGFGGGFKAGLRGSAPITTLIQGGFIRDTIWFNILTKENADEFYFNSRQNHKPTWVDPIQEKAKIPAIGIGMMRGLFWQPAHIELDHPVGGMQCSCCGLNTNSSYTGFKKAKFNYTVEDLWPHPHSPRYLKLKGSDKEQRFASFTTSAPSWTHLNRFVIEEEINKDNKEGQIPAPVVRQSKKIPAVNSQMINLLVGGYQNSQATILDRRHEVLSFSSFEKAVLSEIVRIGLSYKSALRGALYVFSQGMKESSGSEKIKGNGTSVYQIGDNLFYQRTQTAVEKALVTITMDNLSMINNFKKELHIIGEGIFSELTEPYLHDPQLIHTLAVARRTWWKKVNEIEKEVSNV